jgi:DNA-binding CsgD family transcriptional regulator
VLGVVRGRKDQPYTQSDCDLFEQLVPHVKRAITIHKQFCQLDFERRIALQTLDNINMGLALVDQFQQVLFANSQARALLANHDGLALNKQSLQCTDSDTQQRLSEAVDTVIAKAAEGEIEAGRAIAIKRPSGGRDYSLLVSPVWGNLIQVETEALDYPIAVVFMQGPEQASHTQAGLLQELYNLTVAESRVLDLLVSGFSVKEQASQLDIQANTIRTHLKNIFSKTRTNSQAELVKLVMASPLWMGAHAFSLN